MVAIVPMKTMMFEFDTKNAPNSIVNWSLSSLPLPRVFLLICRQVKQQTFRDFLPPPPHSLHHHSLIRSTSEISLFALAAWSWFSIFVEKYFERRHVYMGWWAGGSLKNPILTPRGWSRLGWLRSPPHDHLIDGPFSPRLGTGAPPHQRSQPHRQSGSQKQKAVYARALWVKKVFCPVNSSLKYNYIFPPSHRIMSPNFLLSCFTSDFRTSTGRKKGHFHFLLNILSESSETLNFVVKSI